MEEAPTKADAATRKRRSSILKSQRAPRTPFSELEFTVTTPTDTGKSRRVSFSRRTGVAEFATNEATTTWKNFYEEHNKSLESSGNDSGANAPRQTASLGRRSFFDKQFQEVEGVDFIETLNPRNPNFNTSVSHINFTDQLAGLDNTQGDKKLEAPQQHFELSSFTDHQTKLFEDDIGITTMGEVTDRIDMNFSMVQTIGSKDKDDLEQLQKDIQQGPSNRNYPTRDGKDLSEYIEFDLDVTRAPIHEDVSDMSITDTILSPKVQNVSKSNSVLQKSQGNTDWIADKENIILNPYAAPREADKFAINEEPDKVLVFDGKRLTVQSTNTSKIENVTKEPQRKTIVLNMHDDLPNFVDELSVSKQLAHKFDNNERSVDDISNISMTQSVPTNIISGQVAIHERRRTILFTDSNISVTQAIPSKVIIPAEFNVFETANKTQPNDECDISMTQAVIKNVILTKSPIKSKRNTVIFDNDSGDISMTQVLPANLLLAQNSEVKSINETVKFQDNDISMTQALPAQLIFDTCTSDTGNTARRKTIVYDENSGDISCTQVIPTNIIMQQPNMEPTSNNSNKSLSNLCMPLETLIDNQPRDSESSQSNKRKTIVFFDDAADISVTQAIPTNILNANDAGNTGRRKTIVYDEDNGDISCTQVIPSNIIMQQRNVEPISNDSNKTLPKTSISQETLVDKNQPNGSENSQSNKRKTIVFLDDAADISVTQAIPTNILIAKPDENTGRRKTIVYDERSDDISCTQVIPTNIILPEPNMESTTINTDKTFSKSHVSNQPDNEISICTSPNLADPIKEIENNLSNKRKTFVFEDDAADVSVTQAIPSSILSAVNSARRKTIVYDEDSADISCTRVIPSNIIMTQPKIEQNSNNTHKTFSNSDILEETCVDNEKVISNCPTSPERTKEKKTNQSQKRKTIVFEDNSDNISVTQTIPTNILSAKSTTRKTILFEQEVSDISVRLATPTNIIINESSHATTVSQFEDTNKPHIHALETSLRNKSQSVHSQELDTKEDKGSSLLNIKESVEDVYSVSLNKEDLSKTQDVLDQISAIIDCSNTKLPQETSDNAYQTSNLNIKPKDMVPFTTSTGDPKTDEIITKPIQNFLIYQTSTNHGNIYSSKRNISQENEIDPDNGRSEILSSNSEFSKQSDIVSRPASLPQSTESREENRALTSDENFQLQDVECPNSSACVSKVSQNLINATNNSKMAYKSPDKMKSMLNELLDMSNAAIDCVQDNKLATSKSLKESTKVSKSVNSYINTIDNFEVDTDVTEMSHNTSTTSGDDRMIYIIQDKDVESENRVKGNVIIPILHKTPEARKTENVGGVKPRNNEAQSIAKFKPDVTNNTFKQNEIIVLDNSYTNREISVQNMQNDAPKKEPLTESNEGNYPNGYLAIIRDSTDELIVNKVESNSNSIDVQCGLEENSSSDIVEVRRPSFAPRQSMINREDFFNDISMAQQILQNTKLEIDESMNDATTECTLESIDDLDEFMEKSRTTNEVVKKLQFEDESTSEIDSRAVASKGSPLRKSYAVSESAQDTETKSRVIPPYLKYVSEELKDLMSDLVKPTADTMPFEGLDNNSEHAPHPSNVPEREVSVCSNQIQANLITSSQIDVDSELCSDSESVNVANVNQSRMKSVSFATAIKMDEDTESDSISRNESFVNRQSILQVSPQIIRPHSRTTACEPNPIIVFDDQNPLNNVLFSPLRAGESSFKHEPCIPKMSINENVSMQYRFKTSTEVGSPLQSGDTADISSNESKIFSLDKSPVTNQQLCERKDTTVNTVITMRGNKDLLKVSSLTLVDDVTSDNKMEIGEDSDKNESLESVINIKAKKRFYSPKSKNSTGADHSPNPITKMFKRSTSPKIKKEVKSINISSSEDLSVLETRTQDSKDLRSNVQVIYTSGNNTSSSSKKSKRKNFSFFRKNRSPVSSPTESSEPNDSRHMKKVKKILKEESDLSPPPISRRRGNKHVKFPKSKKPQKTGTNLTVQHLSTDYVRRSDVSETPKLFESLQEAIKTKKGTRVRNKHEISVGDVGLQANDCSDSISSWTSNMSSPLKMTSDKDSMCTVFSKLHKEPPLASEPISKCKARQGDSLNVVPMIETLPDIRGNKCRWDASGNDTWTFSLLHGRLRLCVIFEHKVDNALKSCVRADTPVQSVNLYTAYQDETNTIAAICANFTAGSIRYILSHAICKRADAVPAILKKTMALVRVALNWARAMHEAWYRLAFKLNDNNMLSLKVANIPLRSVWEVTMRFELVVQESGEVPWPKAMDVQARGLLADDQITEKEIAGLMQDFPNDWSHVPRTLWKVFKYLKNKKHDDMGWPAV